MRGIIEDKQIWNVYNKPEIATLLKMYYKTLGFEAFKLPDYNMDLMYYNQQKTENSILIMKEHTSYSEIMNIFQDFENTKKIIIYLAQEDYKKRRLQKKLQDEFLLIDREELNKKIKKNSPLLWIDIKLACKKFTGEFLSIKSKLRRLWNEEHEKENPTYHDYEIDKSYFKKLWRLKDEASYLQKNLQFLQSLFEKEGLNFDYINDSVGLLFYSINELDHSMSTINKELSDLIKNYQEFCRLVIQETIDRSNWLYFNQKSNLLISAKICAKYDLEKSVDLERWENSAQKIEDKRLRKPHLTDSIANVCGGFAGSLWAIESYVDDLFEYANIRFQLNEENELVLNDAYQYKEMDVEELVDKREDKNLEFKASLSWNLNSEEHTPRDLERAVLKTIIAFLNTDGGTLLIGVKDNKSIFGIEKDLEKFGSTDDYELHLSSLIRDKIGGYYKSFIHINFEEIEEKKICRIDVDPSSEPAYLKENNRELFYIRGGNHSENLKTSEIKKYIDENWDLE